MEGDLWAPGPGDNSGFDFYPRPPGGGRLVFEIITNEGVTVISIHALRVEGDVCERGHAEQLPYIFLSTPSGWRATTAFRICAFGVNFYPRPPGGGRLLGATTQNTFKFISIHALRVEGDLYSHSKASLLLHFYPRPPGGGRLGIIRGQARKD